MNLRRKRSFVGMPSGTMLFVRGIDTQTYAIVVNDRTEMIYENRCASLVNGRFGLSVGTTKTQLLLRISST